MEIFIPIDSIDAERKVARIKAEAFDFKTLPDLRKGAADFADKGGEVSFARNPAASLHRAAGSFEIRDISKGAWNAIAGNVVHGVVLTSDDEGRSIDQMMLADSGSGERRESKMKGPRLTELFEKALQDRTGEHMAKGKDQTITSGQRAILDSYAGTLHRDCPGMKAGELNSHVHRLAEAIGCEAVASLGAPYDLQYDDGVGGPGARVDTPEKIAKANFRAGLAKVRANPQIVRSFVFKARTPDWTDEIAKIDPKDPQALRKALSITRANATRRPGSFSKAS